jgi:hypothetical protein
MKAKSDTQPAESSEEKEKEGVDDTSKDGENDEDDPYFGGDKSMEQEE